MSHRDSSIAEEQSARPTEDYIGSKERLLRSSINAISPS